MCVACNVQRTSGNPKELVEEKKKEEKKGKGRKEVTKLNTYDPHAPTASRETTAALGMNSFAQ